MTDDLLEESVPEIPEGFERMNWFQGFGRQIGPLYERNDPDGSYVRAFLVGDHHLNGMKNCHGGMLMAFADTALGHAVTKRANRFWVTVRMVTDFLDGAHLGDWVQGTGEIAAIDDDFFTVQGRIWTESRPIMSATGVFKALGVRPSKKNRQ